MDLETIGLGVERATRPVRTAAVRGDLQRRPRTAGIAQDRRRIHRADPKSLDDLERFGAQRRCELDQVFDTDTLTIEGERPGGERLRRAGLFPGYRRLWHRTLLDRPDRLAGLAVEDEQVGLLCRLRQGLDA